MNEDSWGVFLTQIADAPAIKSVNMQVLEAAPIEALGTRLLIELSLPSPQPDGSPSPADFKLLGKFEEACLVALGRLLDSPHVGTITVGGTRTWVFYTAAAVDESAIERVMRSAGGLRWTAQFEEDPEWSYFFENVAPTNEEIRFAGDMAVVEALANAGDEHSIPRQVDHCALFATEFARAKFIESIETQGFEVTEAESTEDEEHPFMVEFRRTDPVELGHINSVTVELEQLCEEHEGIYDGWATHVVHATKPPKRSLWKRVAGWLGARDEK